MKLNVVPYMGGKFFIAKWIIKHMCWHEVYVEVFGGGANVLLQKPKSHIEVLNDYDSDVYNFYKILLERKKEFWEKLNYLPYSRKFYEDYNQEWKNGYKGKDNLERAVRWYYLQSLGFGGTMGNNFRISRLKNEAKTYFGKVDKIPYLVRRLQKVIIENLDFEKCIKNYDSTKTLFYCDPPYWIDRNYYGIKFGEEDHIRLAKCLNKVEGRVILSYYYNEKMKKYYSNWWVNKREISKFSAYTKDGNCPIAEELLLMNYHLKGTKKFKDYVTKI